MEAGEFVKVFEQNSIAQRNKELRFSQHSDFSKKKIMAPKSKFSFLIRT